MDRHQAIEATARAICISLGRQPDDKVMYAYSQEAVDRAGFVGKLPGVDGAWVCSIPEAATFVAAHEALTSATIITKPSSRS